MVCIQICAIIFFCILIANHWHHLKFNTIWKDFNENRNYKIEIKEAKKQEQQYLFTTNEYKVFGNGIKDIYILYKNNKITFQEGLEKNVMTIETLLKDTHQIEKTKQIEKYKAKDYSIIILKQTGELDQLIISKP